MTSLPLLRLPSLAIIEILKEIGIFDLIQLSRTSIKVAQLIQRNLKICNCSMKIYAFENRRHFELNSKNEKVEIRINRACDYPRYVIRDYWKYENQTNLVEFLPNRRIILYLDNPALGLISTGQHLFKLFKCSVSKVKLHELPGQTLEAIVTLLENHEVQRLDIIAQRADNIQLVLDKIRVVDELFLLKEFDPPLILRNVPKEVRIVNSSWITVEHLQEMNFEKLVLHFSSLTNRDLDSLVTKWKNGEFPKLKHIHVTSNMINTEVPIGGMMPPIFNANRNQNVAPKRIGGVLATVNGGVEIERIDGVKGRIIVKTEPRNTFFSLFVSD